MAFGSAHRESKGKAAERLRSLTLWLTAASLVFAAIGFVLAGVRPTSEGATFVSLFLLLLLGIAAAMRWRSGRDSPAGDALGAMGLIWLAGFGCGAISLLVLHAGFPVADPLLLSMDRALGLDALAITAALADLPGVTWGLRTVYALSIWVLFLSLMVAAMLGERTRVWATAAGFVGTLLTCCLVSGLLPATGAFVSIDPQLLARLPENSGTYAFAAFDAHYGGTARTLGLGSLDGVVCFPSFHTAIGLLTASLWWKKARTRWPAAVWAALVILSTIPIGGHYVIDLAGGAAVFLVWHRLIAWVAAPPLTGSVQETHPRAYA